MDHRTCTASFLTGASCGRWRRSGRQTGRWAWAGYSPRPAGPCSAGRSMGFTRCSPATAFRPGASLAVHVPRTRDARATRNLLLPAGVLCGRPGSGWRTRRVAGAAGFQWLHRERVWDRGLGSPHPPSPASHRTPTLAQPAFCQVYFPLHRRLEGCLHWARVHPGGTTARIAVGRRWQTLTPAQPCQDAPRARAGRSRPEDLPALTTSRTRCSGIRRSMPDSSMTSKAWRSHSGSTTPRNATR